MIDISNYTTSLHPDGKAVKFSEDCCHSVALSLPNVNNKGNVYCLGSLLGCRFCAFVEYKGYIVGF